MAEDILFTPCPICNQFRTREIIVNLKNTSILICPYCGGESSEITPSEEEFSRLYNYFNPSVIARKHMNYYFKQALIILMREAKEYGIGLPNSIRPLFFFDYGCGGGHFIRAANELGFKAIGMETDPVSVESAVKEGLEVYEGSLPLCIDKLMGMKFDWVKCMHVLEHVPHPFEVIRSLSDLTRREGILILSVPDQDSFPARLKKMIRFFRIKRNEWGFVQPPIHLHGFKKATFLKIAERLDLNLVVIKRTSPLDKKTFPTVPEYWKGLRMQRMVYGAGKLLGSGGHLTVVFRKK